ncbi:FAD-binding protein [Thermodesulfobacterium sp. TA1]|uniref:FAD-binding oxidoreductase n=1 Tax=Thermodesulfobacterium sp. TA1 TaxID=2234087 RepID=UPI001232C190|nr:FAD-linked oxidase C-terminal domain-containing protein [Thermodesulfobacterium sp. TA1]QER42208.1 FAD-binding protein [Thermodesulfobacterium sp. TA1]
MKYSFKFLSKLEEILGKEKVFTEPKDLLVYSYDSSSATGVPLAVAFPERKEEVVEVLRLIAEYKVPLVPRGAGTATTGSAVSHNHGLVLSFERMNRILDLNLEERLVVVEPGVLNGELKRYLKKFGLFYPPDPASYAYSTIGGNVATGAGGPRGLKYGTTKDYVLALEVGLPGGKIFWTGPFTLKGVVGYNLTPLFVGSEGTLGVFTEIVLKVIPFPEKRVLLVSYHREEEEPLEIISELLKSLITPASAEFIDKTTLLALLKNKRLELPDKGVQSLLFLELDGEEGMVQKELKKVEDLYQTKGIFYHKAESEEKIETLWEVRRGVSPSVRMLGEKKISDDVVLPRRNMKEFLKRIRDLEEKTGVYVCCFGHAGDGNFHVNLLFGPKKEEKAKALRNTILKEVLNLKGTLSGEHGIGYVKRSFVAWELSSFQLELMKNLKKMFDPDNLLNPGVKIPF